jgi:hypothetical protein
MKASGAVFMFCAPGLVFGGAECVRSRFHILRAQTRFRRYRGSRVPFSCFALPDSFSAVPRASGPVFMFCAPGHIFGNAESVGSRFHVLRARTRFRLYRGRRVSFSCFVLPNSFSAVRGRRVPFHVVRSWTRFRRCPVRRVPFSCFARPDSCSAVPRASGPVFMFCAPGLVFGFAEFVGSRFHVLSARTRVRWYRGRRVPFSCFALPDSFSAVPWASSPVFTFCAPGLIFDGTEGVGSRFHVLRSQTPFRRYRGR